MNLTQKFEELAETQAPPMMIDIERAREVGRRRLYTRRATLFGGIAVAAGAAALTGPAIVRAITEPKPEPATPPRSPGLLITYATFGWLPESLNRVDFTKGAHGDNTVAVNENDDLGTHMVLSVHPGGDVPNLPHFKNRAQQQHTMPAPPVNGRTAYWVTGTAGDPLNGGEELFVLWQSADDQWTLLNAYYLTRFFAEPMAVVHRVASDVTVAEQAQPIPVRIDLPAKFRISDITLTRPMRKDHGTGAWQLDIGYETTRPAFGILVQPEGTLPKKTPDGRDKQLVCKVAEGVEVCVTVGQYTDPEAIAELGGPQGVLDHFTPLGMDESRWVTN